MHIYIHADDPADFTPDGNKELVAIWQPLEEGYGEDLFLMTREYYDREVAP